MEWDNRAFIITSGIYSLLLFLFLFGIAFRTPLPLPGEEGILINFGDSESGFGQVEPQKVEKAKPRPQLTKQVSTPDVKPVQMTQDFDDEAPTINAPKEQTVTPKPQKKEIEEEPKEEKKPEVDQRALFGPNRNTKSSSSEGIAGSDGNQGDPGGDPKSNTRSLGGGVGNGISYNLGTRGYINLPEPTFNVQREGTVVVSITVNKEGRVIAASPGAKGTTVIDQSLFEAAKKAALKSRFEPDDKLERQNGTITYVFRLR